MSGSAKRSKEEEDSNVKRNKIDVTSWLKNDKENYITNILKNNVTGYILKKHETEIVTKLYEASQADPKYDVLHFKVGIEKQHNTRCIFIVDKNQVEHSISKKILAGRKVNSKLILKQAMRNEINYQIENWKSENPKPCDDEYEVDHNNKTFSDLTEEFFKIYDGDTSQTQEQINRKELNSEMKKEWTQFHQENAELRWLSKQANRQNGVEQLRKNILKKKLSSNINI